ncbi:MAG TPA: hypothetical protein VFD17_05960 [Clostridia bacterium]|nr:hypothetical protein [Clostridia bacterium]
MNNKQNCINIRFNQPLILKYEELIKFGLHAISVQLASFWQYII